MQIIRTIVWVFLTAMLVAFIAMNWERAPVNFWPLENAYLHFEWPVGVIALVFFLFGLVPMYLVYRTTRWQLGRRIASLENSLKAASITPAHSTVTAAVTNAEADEAAARAERHEP